MSRPTCKCPKTRVIELDCVTYCAKRSKALGRTTNNLGEQQTSAIQTIRGKEFELDSTRLGELNTCTDLYLKSVGGELSTFADYMGLAEIYDIFGCTYLEILARDAALSYAIDTPDHSPLETLNLANTLIVKTGELGLIDLAKTYQNEYRVPAFKSLDRYFPEGLIGKLDEQSKKQISEFEHLPPLHRPSQ